MSALTDIYVDPGFMEMWGHSDDCLDVLMLLGQDVHDQYNLIAPRRTGYMVHQTKLHPEKAPRSWEVELVADTHYAKFVEAGTSKMAAQHNLLNALIGVAGENNAG